MGRGLIAQLRLSLRLQARAVRVSSRSVRGLLYRAWLHAQTRCMRATVRGCVEEAGRRVVLVGRSPKCAVMSVMIFVTA